jgi:hypothetical protein
MKSTALLLCCAALGGCASTTPAWDARFGDTARITLSQQVLRPDAARSAAPVSGMDGRAAASAYEQYQKSFQNREPQAPAPGQ